jgi:Na+-translocating ferredoxin:NAD+ oxidoreductase RNF subunit RnfB
MIMQIAVPVAAMGGLGLLFGAGLAYALKIFGIEVDPKAALIITKLPGSNCGACGKAGCAGFAEALRKGEVMPVSCVVSNDEARQAISEILGIEYNPKVKTTATHICNGGRNAKDKYAYRGIKHCRAASLVFGGYKMCSFGCLGLGDCVQACPFGALRINAQGIPEVEAKRCTACGKCVQACPKNLFVITLLENRYYVKCNSTDAGAAVSKVCSAGCIGCRKCEKACPTGAIGVESNLARIDCARCKNMGKCYEACPTRVIIRRQ